MLSFVGPPRGSPGYLSLFFFFSLTRSGIGMVKLLDVPATRRPSNPVSISLGMPARTAWILTSALIASLSTLFMNLGSGL